jgi:DNA-binding LytR/AlgR family response regulator
MHVAIIEDNELDLEHLKILLKEFDGCEVVGCAANMDEGMTMLERKRPQLVLLDVQVGNQNSLDSIRTLDYEPLVICTTLYDSHALKAYEVGAVDYLTKPLTAEKLARAFRRVLPRVERSDRVPDVVLVKSGATTRVIPVDQIQMIRGERDYTSVYLAGESLLCGKRMRDWSDLLPSRFVQIDRSTIINTAKIESFTRASRSSLGKILFHGGDEADIGMTASRKLQEQFS